MNKPSSIFSVSAPLTASSVSLSLLLLVSLGLFVGIVPLVHAQVSNGTLQLELSYDSMPDLDPDNNGIESTQGIIDISANVENISSFNQSNLCTIWDIYSIDSQSSQSACYGNTQCCTVLGFLNARDQWNESLLLSYGLFNSTQKNIVSAQVNYIEYSLGQNPFSIIYVSNWDSLNATFLSNGFGILSASNFQNLTFTNTSVSVAIIDPDNRTTLQSGEDVILNLSFNKSIDLSYAFRNIAHPFTNKTSVMDALIGGLPYNIIDNGAYNITISLIDSAKTTQFNYTIRISDTNGPVIVINLSNQSSITTTTLNLVLNISSDEHSIISYNFNNQGASSNIDLGEQKSSVISLNPIYGANTLRITAIDMHGNSRQHFYSFTYTEQSSCNDGTKNGNEQGVDCGGSCNACVVLDMSFDKQSYTQGEDIFASVIARANSFVDFTIYKDSISQFRHNFTPVFSGAPIAETRRVSAMTVPGSYIGYAEMHYLNYSEFKTINFAINAPQNPLSLSLGLNASTINEGDPVAFSSVVSGNSGSVSYAWDFNNDKSTDSTEANPVWFFGTNGTFIVNLSISDSQNTRSQTVSIQAKKTHNVTIYVRENASLSNIVGAETRFDSYRQNTSGDGSSIFSVPSGTYNLRVEKTGYSLYSDPLLIKENQVAYINLSKIDVSAPIVQIIKPQNFSMTNTENVSLTFVATDENLMTCRLFFAANDSTLSTIIDQKYEVASNAEQTFFLGTLLEGSYQWRVDCVDKRGNLGSSPIYFFTHSLAAIQTQQNSAQVALEGEVQDTTGLIEELNVVLDDIQTLSSKEQEAVSLMQLSSYIEKSKLQVERVNRDLSSLQWRRLNETEEEKERQQILSRIDLVRKTTPRTITVANTYEFVKYAEKEDVRGLLEVLLNRTSSKFTSKALRSLTDENTQLQKLITVTTKAYVLDVEYLSGESGSITVVKKSWNLKDRETSYRVFEIIPKSIASQINETTIITTYETIEIDPIIELDGSTTELIYYVFKAVSESQIQESKTILIDTGFDLKDQSRFTGFAIFEDIGLTLVKTTDIRLIIEIFIIILLAVIYLIYSFGGIEQIRMHMQGKDVRELRNMLEHAQQHLSRNEYEKAVSVQKDISTRYSLLDAKKKGLLKSDLSELTYDINLAFIDKLVQEAIITSKASKKHALFIYQKIQSLYKIIPKKHKSIVAKKCMELHALLSSKNN